MKTAENGTFFLVGKEWFLEKELKLLNKKRT